VKWSKCLKSEGKITDVEKILKHLELWDVKRKPPPYANTSLGIWYRLIDASYVSGIVADNRKINLFNYLSDGGQRGKRAD